MQALNTEVVKLQVAVLPTASVAVQVTVVTPTGIVDPDGGLQTTTTPGQLSVAVGGGKVTVALDDGGQVGAATAVTLDGQVIVGGCVSLTVTVNVQLDPACAVHVTVVVPLGKKDPEAGEHITVPQDPPVVGAG